jgi:hypothetical protein
MATHIVNFGANPVNTDNAYKQAIESGLDAEHSIIELACNAQDYGTNVNIMLNGKNVSTHPQNKMRLTSVIIKDDGCGMHHDTVLERFRGAYQDSDSHSSDSQMGRNGVGVKTAFQYWKTILVETTTKDYIPREWTCNPSNLDLIDNTYKQLSTLKPGDEDTELRKYTITQKNAVCDEQWERVAHVQSGVKVTLKNPRDSIIIDINEILRRLSHSIEFLSKKDNKITLGYMNESQHATEIVVKPFYKKDKIPEFICSAKGKSTEDVFINISQKESKLFPAYVESIEPIEFDIKITSASDRQDEANDFVMSICGCNIYDSPRRHSGTAGPSQAIMTIMSLDKFDNVTGFAYKIHGYVKCNDIRLKQALRYNKSAIDFQDKYARNFFTYITSLFKELNNIYIDYLKQFNTDQEVTILREVQSEFAKILSSKIDSDSDAKREKDENNDKQQYQSTNAEYVCNSCGKQWKVPKIKTPTYCCEYNIDSNEEGCDSRDICRKTIKSTVPTFKWVPFLGKFCPARFEESSNEMLLAKYHPAFITTQGGKNKITYLKHTAMEKALVALTIQQVKSQEFELSYCDNLKKQFLLKTNKSHTAECVKEWKINGINQAEI